MRNAAADPPRDRRAVAVAGAALGLARALALLAATAAPSPQAGLPPLAAADLARVAAGEVVVRLAPAPGGSPREGIGVAAIDAPPARVFAAVTDFAHWAEFMPFMSRSEARREPDGAILCSQTLALPLGERHYQIKAQIKAQIRAPAAEPARAPAWDGSAAWRASWSYVPGSGNIGGQRGSWTLTPYGPGRTLAVLRLTSDPGGVAAWLADRIAMKSIPWIFNGLRQQVRRGRYAAR